MPISYDPTLPPGITSARNAVGILGKQYTVSWSPDGTLVATGGQDRSVRLWDTKLNLLMVLWGHSAAVFSVAWSPDGQRLASASDDKTVRIWNSGSGICLSTLQGHSDTVNSVMWEPNGKRLATGAYDKTVRIWDSHSGKSIETLRGHSGSVFSVAWSPDGQRLASASHDETIRIWDSDSGKFALKFSGHSDSVFSVAWSPDGQRLASASDDKTVRIWNSQSGEYINRLEAHSDFVRSVAWSPDGQRLASASYDQTVRIWDVRSQFPLARFPLATLQGHSNGVNSVAWSPDGQRLASASDDKAVRIWDSGSGKIIANHQGHSVNLFSAAWSPDGQRLASASADKTVCIWDGDIGICLDTFQGHGKDVFSVAWSPDGRRLVSASADKTVRIWDSIGEIHSGKSILTLQGHSDSILKVSWSPDGQRLASASDDKTVRIWDSQSGKSLTLLQGHSKGVNSVAWSSDGQRLASASADQTIRIWNSHSGICLATLQDIASIFSVAWSPDGQRLASASADKTVRIWDSRSGKLITNHQGHSNAVFSVAWAPDGQWLLSSSNNETLLWRIASDGEAKLGAELPGIKGAVFAGQGLLIAALRGPNYIGAGGSTMLQWLNLDASILGDAESLSVYYNNAKIVLVGDTGVGKTGLSTVLCGKPFADSEESTHARKVHLLNACDETLETNDIEKREVLLWDLAGQPGYRLVHQLHLHEVAVALVVFDARDEKDPLGAVLYWNRALEQSRRAQGERAPQFVKILVSARTDRGTVSVSKERIQKLMQGAGFMAYFETSAKDGLNIDGLREAALSAIDWSKLEKGTTTVIFERIQKFLLQRQQAGLLLSTPRELRRSFQEAWPVGEGPLPPNFEDKFDTNISLLERRDLLRRFSYGDFVLLQPEYLDAYASSIIEAAKGEPDGFGAIAIAKVYAGDFLMSGSERLQDTAQEKLLLPAVVEDFLRHDLAIADGELLIFPSQVTREHVNYPEPAGQTVIFTFEGPLANIYATLAVRLARSGQFRKSDLWQNAATYRAIVSGECGFYLKEIEPGRADLGLFFDEAANEQTRFTFEQFVAEHLEKHANPGSVTRRRIFKCDQCGEPVPDRTAQLRRKNGRFLYECEGCDTSVSLQDGIERIKGHTINVQAKVEAAVEKMNETADEERDLSKISASAKGEAETSRFKEWFGPDESAHLAIVFTDLVGATALGKSKGDYVMSQVQEQHYTHVRRLFARHNGYELQTTGDGLLLVFKSTPAALDFALLLRRDAGAPELSARASIHCGPVIARERDAFGGAINYAHRVIEQAEGAELWISNDAHRALQSVGVPHQSQLQWQEHTRELKGFGEEIVWQLQEQ